MPLYNDILNQITTTASDIGSRNALRKNTIKQRSVKRLNNLSKPQMQAEIRAFWSRKKINRQRITQKDIEDSRQRQYTFIYDDEKNKYDIESLEEQI